MIIECMKLSVSRHNFFGFILDYDVHKRNLTIFDKHILNKKDVKFSSTLTIPPIHFFFSL
jgi:hypothetical protein